MTIQPPQNSKIHTLRPHKINLKNTSARRRRTLRHANVYLRRCADVLHVGTSTCRTRRTAHVGPTLAQRRLYDVFFTSYTQPTPQRSANEPLYDVGTPTKCQRRRYVVRSSYGRRRCNYVGVPPNCLWGCETIKDDGYRYCRKTFLYNVIFVNSVGHELRFYCLLSG